MAVEVSVVAKLFADVVAGHYGQGCAQSAGGKRGLV